MKSNIRILQKILISAFLLLVFASTFTTSVTVSKPTTDLVVTFWFTENDAEKPGVLQLVNDYNAKGVMINGQKVVIQASQKGFFTAREDYKTSFVSQNEPNVFRAARDWVSEFGYKGLIQPLDNFFTQTELSDFIPNSIYMSTYINKTGHSHLFAIPQQVDVPALMFNKAILENASIDTTNLGFNTSWTWTEFEANLNKITANTTISNTTTYGFTMAGMFFGGQALYFGQGGDLFKDNVVSLDNSLIDTPASRSAFQFIKHIADSNTTPDWSQQGWGTINIKFATEGSVAMIQQGPWELKNFLDNSPEFNPSVVGAKPYASADNLGIMQLPRDDSGHQGVPLGMQAYVVSSSISGAKLTAAADFVKFLTSPEAQVDAAMNYYHLPSRTSVYNNATLQASSAWPYIQGYKANIDKAKQVPVHHAWATIEGDLATELETYLSGGQDLDTMIARVTDLWTEVISTSGSVPVLTTGTTSSDGSSSSGSTSVSSGAGSTTSSRDTVDSFQFYALFILLPFVALRKRKHK